MSFLNTYRTSSSSHSLLLPSLSEGEPIAGLKYEYSAVKLKDLQHLFRNVSKEFIPELNDDLQICNSIAKVLPLEDVVRVTTVKEHRLYKFDSLFFSKPDEQPRAGLRRLLTGAVEQPRASLRRLIADGPSHRDEPLSIINVLDAYTFDVRLVPEQLQYFQEGAQIQSPLNMHKLCGEVIIPSTTVEEVVVRLVEQSDVDTLLSALGGQSMFSLTKDITLPSGPELKEGLTVHGCLSKKGFIRRKYWSLTNRKEKWMVKNHVHLQCGACTSVDGGLGEERVTSRSDIKVGSLLVLRRGISYAEACHGGRVLRVRDFISHNWSECSRDFLATMEAAGVTAAWICTLAINQHSIPPLQRDYTHLPFYLALAAVKNYGRVIMAIDLDATTLTRIWCVFEVWVTHFLGLPLHLFMPSGELNFWTGKTESAKLIGMIEKLKLEEAQSTMEEDKTQIIKIIEANGGMAKVTWQVKRKLSMGAVLFLACLVSATSNFLFSLPWISNIARGWFQTVLADPDDTTTPYLENLFVYTICFGSAVAHLKYWALCLHPARVIGTMRALRNTLSMGAGFAKVLAVLAILELANVLFIILNLTIIDVSTSDWVDVLICNAHGNHVYWLLFALMSLYLLQKTLPWIAGWIAGKAVNFEEFLPAAPCIGFLITLSCVTFTMWKQLFDGVQSPSCQDHKHPLDLSHLPMGHENVLDIMVCGLAAWAVSVFQRFVASLIDFLWNRHWLIQSTVIFFAFVVAITVVVWLLICHHAQKLWSDEHWYHLEIGFTIWVVCSTIWHRNFLREKLRVFRRSRRSRDPRVRVPNSQVVTEISDNGNASQPGVSS